MAASSSSSAGGSPAQAPGGGGGGVPHHRARFGDTTLTKVFVGGLAWETPSAGLHDHFKGYGEILEAVVITDRDTGRSKGYGFVTFRDPESARLAVQNPNPVIAGRRANCNIASMGPPRPAQHRGRAPRGPHLPDQQALGYMAPGRMPSQPMATPPYAMFYPPQYGYWYQPDYPYHQQMMQPYFPQPQMYGPTSPSTSQYPYNQLYGYMSGGPGPSSGFSPMQQASRSPFFQQPTAQIEGSFLSGSSLPPDFRLQLPPRAISTQSDDIPGSEPTQPNSETSATSIDNQEESKPVKRSNSDLNTSN